MFPNHPARTNLTRRRHSSFCRPFTPPHRIVLNQQLLEPLLDIKSAVGFRQSAVAEGRAGTQVGVGSR